MDETTVAEFYRWKDLIKTPKWRDYVRLLEERREYLQREVNKCVRDNDHLGAIRWLARKDEIKKIMGKVDDRVKTCNNKEK